jgi:hypothetical protein
VNEARRALRDALAEVPERARLAVLSPADPVPDSAPEEDPQARLKSPDVAPAPGEWSAREVVLHLAAVDEDVWQPRLDALAAEAFPSWPWVEPGLWSGSGDDSFEQALAVYRARRAATVARLDALDAAGWAKRGLHATYGELDVAGLMRIALAHDEEHLAQIARGQAVGGDDPQVLGGRAE